MWELKQKGNSYFFFFPPLSFALRDSLTKSKDFVFWITGSVTVIFISCGKSKKICHWTLLIIMQLLCFASLQFAVLDFGILEDNKSKTLNLRMNVFLFAKLLNVNYINFKTFCYNKYMTYKKLT